MIERANEEDELERLIVEFITARKVAKVEAAEEDHRKGKLDTEGLEAKRSALDTEYEPCAWIAFAAEKAVRNRLRIGTHIAKAVHPDSKGSSLPAQGATAEKWAGTPKSARALDIVGNAAAMDVMDFIRITVAGVTVGERLMADDAALATVLVRHGVDPVATRDAFSRAFAVDEPSADKWLKQVYFPISSDAYHLLAPLYPSSLTHEVHSVVREARFGESATDGRKARWAGAFHEGGYVEYPNLLLEVFGSGKPQNVSVLTNKRRGEAYHFPSCPPIWDPAQARPIWGTRTVFQRVYPRMVRNDVDVLATFLKSERGNNVDLRAHRASLVGQLLHGLINLELTVRSLNAGWTVDERCELDDAERLWLDPGRVELDEDFAAAHGRGHWRREVADRFARWLNKELSRTELPVGDAEHRAWRDEALEVLGAGAEPSEGDPHDHLH